LVPRVDGAFEVDEEIGYLIGSVYFGHCWPPATFLGGVGPLIAV
jgi:hypothetical protein